MRNEAALLPSLAYFKPEYMSLSSPHPLWLSAGTSPYEVIKATVQATMLSGRFRTEKLCRHWSRNKLGLCLAQTCTMRNAIEDLEHILVKCESMERKRQNLLQFTHNYGIQQTQIIQNILYQYCNPKHPKFVQFLLDCSSIPSIICAVQEFGSQILNPLFHVSRTWCYALHRDR